MEKGATLDISLPRKASLNWYTKAFPYKSELSA